MFGIFINCSRYKQYPSYLDTSFARIPPILLKAGIWIPYFSSSCFMALISSSNKEIYNISKTSLLNHLLICFFQTMWTRRVLTYKCLLCFWSNSWLKMTDFVNWRIWNKKVKTIVILCDQHLWWSDGDLSWCTMWTLPVNWTLPYKSSIWGAMPSLKQYRLEK